MDVFSDEWLDREAAPLSMPRVRTYAYALDANESRIAVIAWQQEKGEWFSAWALNSLGPNSYKRAPRLDAADTRHLGDTVGQVVAPDCFNYGPNGVLETETD